MKVICDRGALLEATNVVSGAVASRTPKPQLTCIKLVASKQDGAGQLTLSATDAEIALRVSFAQVDVTEPGEALIPADKLRAIISAEDGDSTLTLESDGDTLHIRGEDAHFQLHGYPPADFPPLADFQSFATGGGGGAPARAVFEHPSGSLLTLISRTVFATARENSRYAINGVLFKREGKRLKLVATDGRRLALCSANVGGDKDAEPISCIVPNKALQMLLKLLEDPEEPVKIAVSDTQIVFSIGADEVGRATLSSNLVEGAFPPFEDVIPRDQDIKVHFDRDVLLSGVRRAALLTNEESRGVRMNFLGNDKRVELASRAPEMGEAQVNVELAGYEGGDIEIGFNPNYVSDALKVINDPEVILELKAPNKPGVIKSGPDFVYVVMPVNLA